MPSVEASAANAADPEEDLRTPHGVGQASLSALVPKARGDRAGIATFASRRLTVCVQILPSRRGRARPPADSTTPPFFPVDTLPYYAGRYVEAGTCVTLRVESLVPLGARPAPPAVRLQRVLVSMPYTDNSLLHAISEVVDDANAAAGVASPSAWQAHSASGV